MSAEANLIAVRIDDLAIDGSSVGRYEGKVVFLDNGLPGELIEARIYKKKARFDLGRAVRIIEPSPARSPVRCSHTTICGGCTWQDLAYAHQLEFKQRQVIACIERLAELPQTVIHPIIGCADQWRYRNKMEFSFAPSDDGECTLGLHHKGRFDQIFDLTDCHLASEATNAIVRIVRDFVRSGNIPVYHIREHTGLIRFLVIRHVQRSGEIMVNLVTSAGSIPGVDQLVAQLTAEVPPIVTIVHNVNSQKANIAVGEHETILFGPGYIEETIDGVRFRIRPNSFFQTNSFQTPVLYQTAFSHFRLQPDDLLLDLYCGTGAIGLLAARTVRRVIGVEEVPAAIVAARENAALNDLPMAEFVQADVRKFLESDPRAASATAAIVDPPRAGLHPKALAKLAVLPLNKIGYISCNPATFARDAKELVANGWQLPSVTPVDMFPHTRHIELVGCFVRR